MIDYTGGFILYLIRHAKRPLTKTTLMKLVYLADVENYRRVGEQLTRMRWYKDQFGPVDYRVLRHAENLGETNHISILRNGTSESYTFADHGSMYLESHWREIADYVIAEYSGLTRRKILDIAYATEPMVPPPAENDFLDFTRIQRYGERPSEPSESGAVFTAFERQRVIESIVTSQACEGIDIPEELVAQWLDEVLAGPLPEIR